jgi:hypothetical protein
MSIAFKKHYSSFQKRYISRGGFSERLIQKEPKLGFFLIKLGFILLQFMFKIQLIQSLFFLIWPPTSAVIIKIENL